MKNFTYFCLSALFAYPLMANAQSVPSQSSFIKMLAKSQPKMKKATAKGASENAIWKATHEKSYGYEYEEDPSAGAWVDYGDYYLTYDNKGNILTETYTSDGESERVTYQYDANGMKISSLSETIAEDGTATPSEKLTIAYDSIVTNKIIKNEQLMWNDGEWVAMGNNYTRTITRDENGNVTSEVIAVLYQGVYDPTRRTTITYKDGKAERYLLEELVSADDGGFEWEFSVGLKDMVWENTNGQVLGELNDFFEGDNRLKSASEYNIQAEGEEYTFATITVEYKDNGGYKLTESNQGINTIVEKTYTDDNGSYEYSQVYYYGKVKPENIMDNYKVVETFDAKGNETFYGEYQTIDNPQKPTLASASKVEYTYDETTGAWTEMVQSDYDMETEQYIFGIKVVADEFVDVTKIDGIKAVHNSLNANAAVYNLQGVRVGDSLNNLPTGLYIQKIGNKTVKVVKK